MRGDVVEGALWDPVESSAILSNPCGTKCDPVEVEVEVSVSNNGPMKGTDNDALGRALLLILSYYHT